jgi:hypothetical protein
MQATDNGGQFWLSYWVDHVTDTAHPTSFYLVSFHSNHSFMSSMHIRHHKIVPTMSLACDKQRPQDVNYWSCDALSALETTCTSFIKVDGS